VESRQGISLDSELEEEEMKPSERLIIEALKSLNNVGIILFATKMKNVTIGLYDVHYDIDATELTMGEVVAKLKVRITSLLGTDNEEEKK